MQGRSFRQANICFDDFKRFKVNSTWRRSWDRQGMVRRGGGLLGLTQGPRGLTDDEFDDRQTDMLM